MVTLKVRITWTDVFTHYKRPQIPIQTTILSKFSITIDGERMTFHKTKGRQYLTMNSRLQKVIGEKLQTKEGNYTQNNQRTNNLRPANQKWVGPT